MAEVKTDEPELDLESIVNDADKKDGTVVVIDDKGDEVKTSPDAKTETQESPEETVAKLRKEIEDSKKNEAEYRSRVEKLEGERAVETQKAISAIDQTFKATETAIEADISSAKINLQAIKHQLKEAREKGDIEAEIELEEKLADTRYKFNALEWQKNNLAQQKRQREDAAKNQVVDDGKPTYSPKAKAWIDAHPRFNSDDDYQATVFAAHDLAVRKGIKPDSEAYFEFVEARVKKAFPDETQSEPTQKEQTRNISVAAPPSRSGAITQKIGQNGRQVHLTAEQLEAADFMGMTPAEYAKELIKIEQEKRNG